MAVYRIDLAYDGTGFRGWARNAGVRTVQGEIESALATVLRGEVALSVAGRTDAGVHARHQVASFAAADLDCAAVLKSARTMLAPEISIHDLRPAPVGFDARFSAVRRSYRYFVDEALFHDPLRSRWVWHFGEALDIEAMNRAAAGLVGPHDFASLCRAADGGTTERTVESARLGAKSAASDVSLQPSAFRPAGASGTRSGHPVTFSSSRSPPRRSVTRWSGRWWRCVSRSGGDESPPTPCRKSWSAKIATPPEEWRRPTAWCCGKWSIESSVPSLQSSARSAPVSG